MKAGRLQSIAVTVERTADVTGNVPPVLREILQALLRFAESGEPTTIDLRGMPFAPGDEDRLIAFLGEGEIRATFESLGRTKIRETRFHGVWLVDYRSDDDVREGLQLEITDMPALLKTPRQDIEDASSALQEALDATEEHLSQERS